MNDLTEIIIVLDRSGSMEAIRSDMAGGLNRFVKEQRKQPGQANLTLVQFDTEYEVLFEGKNIEDVGTLSLVPRGGTALLDAVGKAINVTKERIDKQTNIRPDKVVLLIITDGQENASKEFKKDKIKEMIKERQDKDLWQFVFLGANQDAFAEGAGLGVVGSSTLGYGATGQGVRAMYNSVTQSVSSYRSGASNRVSFTDTDRSAQK